MRGRTAIAVAASVGAAACRSPAPAERLLDLVPPGAAEVLVIEPPRLRGTWLEASLELVRARGRDAVDCAVDAALAADAVVVARARGGGVLVAARGPAPVCPDLAPMRGGWVAAYGDARLRRAGERRLRDDPAFAAMWRRAGAAPVRLIAPRGIAERGDLVGVVGRLDPRGDVWLELRFASSAAAQAARAGWSGVARPDPALGGAGDLARAVEVAVRGDLVEARLDLGADRARRDGPLAAIAIAGALGAPPRPVVTRLAIDRIVAAEAAASAEPLEAIPILRDGRPRGVRVHAIGPGSRWAALGLVSGDAILAIDGAPATRDAVLDLWRRVARAPVAVQIERRGVPLDLTYEAR